jgi:hypothetical protein
VPAQPIDATPSGINLLFKGGVYGPRETDGIFRGAEDRHMVVGRRDSRCIGLGAPSASPILPFAVWSNHSDNLLTIYYNIIYNYMLAFPYPLKSPTARRLVELLRTGYDSPARTCRLPCPTAARRPHLELNLRHQLFPTVYLHHNDGHQARTNIRGYRGPERPVVVAQEDV